MSESQINSQELVYKQVMSIPVLITYSPCVCIVCNAHYNACDVFEISDNYI